METTKGYVVDTQGLGKSYEEVQALKSLSLQVPEHSIFGFLGPNGAGKTTTIKLLIGLASPSAGKAKVFGYDIEKDSIEIRKRIGYLPQEPRFYEHMTARETLRSVLHLYYRGPKDAVENRIQETLDLVGLSDKADRPIRGFSGGEKQRLGIAQAQVNYPDLLILDEPAANLDPMGRRDVLEAMELVRRHATIFYSTHILDDVQRVSDQVAILNHGEMVSQGPIAELLNGADGGKIISITLKGDAQPSYARVAAQDWVTNVDVSTVNHDTTWQVTVSNVEAAESQLLRLVLADEQTTVVSFGRREHNLEEVFLSMVEEDAS